MWGVVLMLTPLRLLGGEVPVVVVHIIIVQLELLICHSFNFDRDDEKK